MAAYLNDSSPKDPLAKFCKHYCDPDENKDGGCDPFCIPRCLTVCTHPINEFPPPYSNAEDLPDVADHDGRPFGVSIFLSVSLAVLATVFVAFCFYSAWRFYSRRRRSGSRSVMPDPGSGRGPGEESGRVDEERGPWVDHPIWYIRTVGLEAAAIQAITVGKFKKGEGLVEGTECSVCLSEFEDGETLRILPKCNHAFHIPCIDTWLASHTNCPNCRAGIVRSRVNSGINSGHLEESDVVVDIAIPESEHESESAESESVQGNGDGNGMLPLRRSVSVSASMINVFSGESGKNKDVVQPETAEKGGGSSSGSGSSSEGSAVKRSVSCSARVFLSRYSRSRAGGGSSLPQ